MNHIDMTCHLALLLALSAVSGYIEKRRTGRTRLDVMLQGALFGGAAGLVMLGPPDPVPSPLLDGRSILVGVGALFYGPLAASVAVAIPLACGIWLGGAGALAGALMILSSAGIGLLTRNRIKPEADPPSAWSLFLFGLIVHLSAFALMILFPGGAGPAVLMRTGLPALVAYPLATILAGKILWDISGRKRVGGALLEGGSILDTLVEAIPVPVFHKDRDGRYLGFNKAFETFFGATRERLVGKTEFDINPKMLAETHRSRDAELLESGGIQQFESHLQNAHGAFRDVIINQAAVTDPLGTVNGLIGTILDITERKQAEKELQHSNDMLRAIIEAAPVAIVGLDLEGNVHSVWNPAAEKMLGWSAREAMGRPLPSVPAENQEEFRGFRETIRSGKALDGIEVHRQKRDGSPIDYSIYASPLRDDEERIYGNIAVLVDITERRRAEQIMQARLRLMQFAASHSLEELLQATLDEAEALTGSAIGFYHFVDADEKTLTLQAWSTHTLDKMCSAEGKGRHYPIDEAGVWVDCVHERRPVIHNDYASLTHRKGMPEGHAPVVRELVTPVFRADKIVAILGVGNKPADYDRNDVKATGMLADLAWDIVEHKFAEEEIGKLWLAIEQSPVSIVITDTSGAIEYVNPKFTEITGYTHDESIGKNPRILKSGETPPEEYRRLWDIVTNGGVWGGEFHNRKKNGDLYWESASISPVMDSYGRIKNFIAVKEDITARKQAEEALRRSEEMYRSIFRNSPLGIFRSTFEGRFIEVNPAMAKMLGYDSPETVVREIDDIAGQIYACAEDRRRILSAQFDSADITQHLNRFRRRDGKEFVANQYLKTVRDAEGRPVFLEGIIEDITEKLLLESQLRHSQKMEAVGRLAGGVAHDFNNMLGVIIGRAELALNRMDKDSPLIIHLQEIRQAAERSANLARQLLAFARKQTIAPRVLALNETVEGMLKMLRHLIGEDIDLVWMPGAESWQVKVDPSQIDQILANLCVNARDAIAGVGKVTLKTSTATFDRGYCADHPGSVPGEYVLLAVSDDGCGMDKETLDKLFEPFFTTKELGKGTGLGLATVYGIVKQNNGFIDVCSKPGHGSTFRIYLPRHTAKSERMPGESPAAPVARGNETVLLVEDEPAILNMARRMLEEFGYRVMAASTPGEAIRLAREHVGEIHLLVTDVVMPEMNGRELTSNLVSLYPGIRRLFMSGYTGDVIAHHGVLDEDVNFIQKPFSVRTLAAKVREVLDSRS